MGMKDTVTFVIKLRHKGRVTTKARANYYGPVLPRYCILILMREETGVREEKPTMGTQLT